MAWAPDYITTAQLKTYRKITNADLDTELALAVTGASRAIDRHCNRQFGVVSVAELRYYTAWPNYRRGVWVVDIDDLMTQTGLVVTIDGTTVTDYTLESLNAAAESRPWTRLIVEADAATTPTGVTGELGITALWGWTAVPSAVLLAARIQAGRFSVRQESLYGIAGATDTGTALRLLSRVDPDVGVSLADYVRPRGPR
jgi:hypothetical protein